MNPVRICIINPNSTVSMTEKCERAARTVAASTTVIKAVNPKDSPASIQGFYDVAKATVPMLDLIERDLTSDAFIIACFDDTGLDAARSLTDRPVLGIGEAAFHMACLVSCRYSVITTLRRSVPGIEHNLKSYGLDARCARVRASEIPVLALEEKDPQVMAALCREIEAAISEDHAEAIVLGCAGMVDLLSDLQDKYKMPIIDGVTSAVVLAEAMVHCGMRTSKIGGYAK